MPFDDEVDAGGVRVHAYRDSWEQEGAALAHQLSDLVPGAVRVEHIGSTSIPGMASKDCLDMMVLVQDFDGSGTAEALEAAGYRRRPEPWNNLEEAHGRTWPKMVFAPPVGGRPVNVHVRLASSETARQALLFRDHFRERPDRAAEWASFKTRAAECAPDLAAYGQLKAPAWRLLMQLAETWASGTGWTPEI
jgi:GrpB-like predicted nucleotidyltransferase (UPF0157 family)